MKTIRIFLAFLALVAVKTNAQEVVVNSPSDKVIVDNTEKSSMIAMVNTTAYNL
jgi:hypothetical protein